MKTRNDLLADLADAVRELTEPRNHTEYREVTVSETVTARKSGKQRTRRTKQRRPHVVTLPGLLDSLRSAAVPGSSEAGSSGGSFESRPSAELEPLAVLREIIDDVGFWMRTFDIDRPTLAKCCSALVSAPHDDEQLARIATQARRWVKRARLATGFDPAPVTIAAPCVYCGKRGLVIAGDHQSARCTRCLVTWTPDTIGLLADMLRANETQETLALERCWQGECGVYGAHEQHRDSRGRTWRDTCDVPGRERIGA